MNREILVGDVLEKLKEIPDESIDVMITSPPYWGLRDYGTGKWEGGDPDCKHESIRHKTREERGGLSDVQEGNTGGFGDESKWTSHTCPDCKAVYKDPQWGSEKSFRDYLAKLDKLMAEMKRVLKKTGSCWVNLGDTYSTISGGMRDISKGNKKQYGDIQYKDKGTGGIEAYGVDQSKMYEGLQTKSRVGIPERFYINCIDNEWIARNHIPWHKNNPMPSSVKDRFSNKWESIFFFVKQQKYYFDLDAVRERTITREKRKTRIQYDGKSADTSAFMPPNPKGKNPGDYFDDTISSRKHSSVAGQPPQSINVEGYHYSHPKGKNPGDVFVDTTKPYAVVEREGIIYYRDLPPHKVIREYLTKARKKIGMTIDKLEEIFDNYTPHHWFDKDGSYPTVEDWTKAKEVLKFDDTYDEVMLTEYPKDAAKVNNPKGKNPGDVFESEDDYYNDTENLTNSGKEQHWAAVRHLSRGQHKSLPGPNSLMWKKPKGHSQFHDRQDIARTGGADHAEWANNPKGKNPGDVFDDFGKYENKETETKHRQGMNRERGDGMVEKRDLPTQKDFVDKLRENFTIDDIVKFGLTKSTVEHWFRYDESGFSYPDVEDWEKVDTDLFPELLEVYYVRDDVKQDPKGKNPGDVFSDDGKAIPHWTTSMKERVNQAREDGADHYSPLGHPAGKNPGDIFNINTHPYPEAHFATFPEALPTKILKCACPKQVCKKCGKPRNPISKPTPEYQKVLDAQIWKEGSQDSQKTGNCLSSPLNPTGGITSEYQTVGHTDCGCNAGWEAGIVLDPFFGSGTTGVAAEKLGLRWIGIELNDEYVGIARKRLDMFRNKKLEDWFDGE